MNDKKPIVQVGYRPSEMAQKLFDEYCSEKAVLNKSQLVEIAIQFLMMRPHKEMDTIIWKFLKGEFDDDALEEKMMKGPKK